MFFSLTPSLKVFIIYNYEEKPLLSILVSNKVEKYKAYTL